MAARLYIFHSIDSFSDADAAVALARVPAWRRAKALSYVNMPHRKLSLIAALLLQLAAGGPHQAAAAHPHGKPRFADPRLPRFSLSHCPLAVACMASPGHEVGVDVEPWSSYSEDVARQVLSEAELAEALGRPDAFARLWTMKESYLKLTGRGLDANLPQALATARGVHFRTFQFAQGYACTACSTHDELNGLDPIIVSKSDLFRERLAI